MKDTLSGVKQWQSTSLNSNIYKNEKILDLHLQHNLFCTITRQLMWTPRRLYRTWDAKLQLFCHAHSPPCGDWMKNGLWFQCVSKELLHSSPANETATTCYSVPCSATDSEIVPGLKRQRLPVCHLVCFAPAGGNVFYKDQPRCPVWVCDDVMSCDVM